MPNGFPRGRRSGFTNAPGRFLVPVSAKFPMAPRESIAAYRWEIRAFGYSTLARIFQNRAPPVGAKKKDYFLTHLRPYHPSPAMPINNNANELGSGTTAGEERLATRKPRRELTAVGKPANRCDDDK